MADVATQEEVTDVQEVVDESTVDESAELEDKGAESLGDAGKQALDRMKARLKTERDARLAAERERDEAKGVTEAEKATRAAEATVLARANQRIVRSEIKAAAKGVLNDPSDAFRFLDLDKYEVDDDGNVDEDEIAADLVALASEKPYLAMAQGQQQRFQGGSDQGARKASQKSEEQQLTEQLGEANKRRDFESAIAIKQRLAAIRAASRSA